MTHENRVLYCRNQWHPPRQGVNIDQADLQEMQREGCQFLLIEPVGLEISFVSVENEGCRSIPVLNNVESLVNLPPECLRG